MVCRALTHGEKNHLFNNNKNQQAAFDDYYYESTVRTLYQTIQASESDEHS
jgi:hypothetical protein